jgi:2'-5' RNA ligase
VRLFVSADVDELADPVAAIQEPVAGASGLRLTDPEQAHVTRLHEEIEDPVLGFDPTVERSPLPE